MKYLNMELSVNINIKGPLGHSDHELSENEQHISCPGFYPDKLMIWYVDQGTQLQIES